MNFPSAAMLQPTGYIPTKRLTFRMRKVCLLFVLLKIVCRFLVKFTFAFIKQRAERLQNIAAAPLCIFSDSIQQRKTAPKA